MEITFQQIYESNEGASAAETGRGNSMFKGPEAGMSLPCLKIQNASLIKSVSKGEGARQ